jgi:hypothetical protein
MSRLDVSTEKSLVKRMPLAGLSYSGARGYGTTNTVSPKSFSVSNTIGAQKITTPTSSQRTVAGTLSFCSCSTLAIE